MGQRKPNKNVDPADHFQLPCSEEQRQVTGPLQNTAGAEKFPPTQSRRAWINGAFAMGIPESRGAGLPHKPLILLVGAAGFEPTTCSTQNCRATRLRYTPRCQEKALGDVDTRSQRPQQGMAGPRTPQAAAALRGRRNRSQPVSARRQAIPSPGGSRPPSCPWSPARSAPARIGPDAARSCRSAAASPCGRRCRGYPRRR